VLLVADAKGASRSVAAQVKGFAVFEPGISLVGVVANRCASASHAELLAQALASASLPPLAGFMGSGAFPTLGGRHLGLVTADTGTLPTATIAAFAAAGEKNLSLAAIIELARQAEPLAASAAPATAGKKKIPVAVAYDRAFHFYYQDTWDALKSCGGELLFYSPLRDKALPEGAAGLYIGGGYPEVYAEELAANHAMGEALRAFAASGRPVYAECGGLMYLSESLETAPGKRYPMSGVLPAGTRMGNTKKFLGYVEATLKEDSLWGRKGDLFRGHEFHYSELTSGGWRIPAGRRCTPCGETGRARSFPKATNVVIFWLVMPIFITPPGRRQCHILLPNAEVLYEKSFYSRFPGGALKRSGDRGPLF
ncbi:MAG: cobyrinate a,c-diamide synthase, partial [Syntrophales bacterium]